MMRGMKKLITVVIVLLLIIVAVLFTAAHFAKSIISSYQPQIEAEASKVLGTKVALGDIDIGFWPNVTIETKNLALGTDPQGPKLGLFRASVAVTPLFSKQIQIKEVIITAPSATIKQTNNGIEVVGLPLQQKDQTGETRTAPAETKSSATSTKPAELPVTVDLDKFELKNAAFTFINETNGQRFDIKDLSLKTHLSLAKNILTIPDLSGGLSVNGSPMSYGLKGKFSPTALDLTELTFEAFNGTGIVKSSGEIGKQLATTVSLKGFESSSALAIVKPDLADRISGTLSDLSAKFSTTFTSQGVVTTGDGSVEIADGGIKGVNLFAPLVTSVLKASAPAPSSSDAPLELSAEEQTALDSNDTTFSKITTKFALSRPGITFDGLSILSPLFELQGNGAITTTAEVDIKAALVLSERLSSVLIKKNKDLANVARPDKRIEAPIIISGPVQKPVVVPDVSKLLQNVLTGKLADKADKALQKALGNKGISLKGFGF